MWWARKDEDGGSSSNNSYTNNSASAKKKRTASTPSKKSRLGSTNGRQKGAPASASLVSRRRPRLGKKKSTRNVDGGSAGGGEEDVDITTVASSVGIEVALSGSDADHAAATPEHAGFTGVGVGSSSRKKGQPQKPPVSPKKTVVSFQRELISREKVNRGQFNVNQWPALAADTKKKNHYLENAFGGGSSSSTKNNSTTTPVVGAPPNAKNGRHRVRLSGADDRKKDEMSYHDMLYLLKNQDIPDEGACLEMEIKHLNAELDALREDRAHLEAMSLQIPEDPQTKAADWEKHRLLAGRRITQAQRKVLQDSRGNELTICMKNNTTAKALAESLGAKRAVLSEYTADERPHKVLHLTPQNCRDGGAGTTLQHISLSHQGNDESSFFFSHDHNKGSWLGRLPARLFRRMKDNGMDPKEAAANLVFLASGPMEYYYAEFRSGEVWWGSPPNDDTFQNLCNDWDVYRVAFGPITSLIDGTGDQKEHLSPSWIILGRDGRVAWKNLPTRLHYMLKSRLANEAAVEEVALGSGDSYFVRFLDGTVDYCLPAHMGSVCQKLEQEGATLTSISLHPNLPYDFVIRSTRP